MGQRNEKTVSSGYIKRRFPSILQSSYVSKSKINKGQRCVSDSRHINTRILKTNLAFPLVNDVFFQS